MTMYATLIKTAVLLAAWFILCAINDGIEIKEQREAQRAEAERQRELLHKRVAWTINKNRHSLWSDYTKEM